MILINYTPVKETYFEPQVSSSEAAGADLRAAERVEIHPGETVKISTGIAIEILSGYFGAICARSGLATKQGLRPANCVGIVDSDYRGEVLVPLYNDSSETRIIEIGDRIAQIIIIPYLPISFNKVDKLNNTERGTNGFGSTGIK